MAAQRVAVRWPTMNGNWASSLTLFAKNPKPATLPNGVYLRHDEHTVTIYDGYPKAKYHFLVLPRIPFKLERTHDANSSTAPPKLGLAGGKLSLGVSSSFPSRVPDTHLRSLYDVLASPYAGQILDKLHIASREVVQLVKEEMKATTKGVEWGVRVGFHAVPSMETVHVHIISDDLVSDRLKNKKHYQSFHSTHGFWLDLADVQDLVSNGKKSLPHSAKYYEELLRSPLISFRNQKEYSNIPKLKEHLEQAWKEEVEKKSQALTADSKKRKPEDSEEDGDGKSRRTKSTTPSSSATESEN